MDTQAKKLVRRLRRLELESAELPDTVSEWPRMSSNDRLSAHHDWLRLIVDDIEALNEAAANGTLDASERRRYETVRDLLNNSEDALRLLDVPTLKESEALPSGLPVPA